LSNFTETSMKIKHLMEGAEPKLAGAPEGIQIMTPQQFVAKAGDMPGEESEQGVAEDTLEEDEYDKMLRDLLKARPDLTKKYAKDVQKSKDIESGKELNKLVKKNPGVLKTYSDAVKRDKKLGVAEGVRDLGYDAQSLIMKLRRDVEEKRLQPTPQAVLAAARELAGDMDFAPQLLVKQVLGQGVAEGSEEAEKYKAHLLKTAPRIMDFLAKTVKGWRPSEQEMLGAIDTAYTIMKHTGDVKQAGKAMMDELNTLHRMSQGQQGVAEGEDHLAEIRKLSGLGEATKLPAQTRDLGSDEFQDYMKRIVGTPDVDKQGNVKTDKKGNEKYVSGKTKTDRYKMPYIHRSSVIEYLGPDGENYSEDKIKAALGQRPKKLLKQNEKMKHSNGELEQFFNVGFAALTGIALDEETNNLIIVNTCPGAGSCKVDCFAMKGGKVQFKAAWLSDGRILTYLLNDPDGFFGQLSAEIAKEEKLGDKGGYEVTIRWHDAGDFFSPEYLDMALKMAAQHPGVKFYAYTKMADAALAQKPANFIINWSEGANTGQEKQVKAKDANLDTTKNSRIVPDDLFQDLLVKDEKKNLVKGPSGQSQVQPDKLPELKQRLASEYGLSANSILSYDEYMAKRKSIPAGMKYNVIVAPGEGDISANDPNIISTLLLKH